jgi:hypothetical protein
MAQTILIEYPDYLANSMRLSCSESLIERILELANET